MVWYLSLNTFIPFGGALRNKEFLETDLAEKTVFESVYWENGTSLRLDFNAEAYFFLWWILFDEVISDFFISYAICKEIQNFSNFLE